MNEPPPPVYPDLGSQREMTPSATLLLGSKPVRSAGRNDVNVSTKSIDLAVGAGHSCEAVDCMASPASVNLTRQQPSCALRYFHGADLLRLDCEHLAW